MTFIVHVLTHSLEVSQIGSGLLRHLEKQHPDFKYFS